MHIVHQVGWSAVEAEQVAFDERCPLTAGIPSPMRRRHCAGCAGGGQRQPRPAAVCHRPVQVRAGEADGNTLLVILPARPVSAGPHGRCRCQCFACMTCHLCSQVLCAHCCSSSTPPPRIPLGPAARCSRTTRSAWCGTRQPTSSQVRCRQSWLAACVYCEHKAPL